MQMRAERPRRFAFAFFSLRFTLSLRPGCCVDRLRPPRIEETTRLAIPPTDLGLDYFRARSGQAETAQADL